MQVRVYFDGKQQLLTDYRRRTFIPLVVEQPLHTLQLPTFTDES